MALSQWVPRVITQRIRAPPAVDGAPQMAQQDPDYDEEEGVPMSVRHDDSGIMPNFPLSFRSLRHGALVVVGEWKLKFEQELLRRETIERDSSESKRQWEATSL